MDEPTAGAWGPKPAAIGAAAVGAVAMAVACATLATDPPGRILAGVAAAGLLIFAAGSWRGRPRLAMCADGLVYRGWLRTETLPRAEIESISITAFRRWGRPVRLLEIDTESGRLFVLSRWDLGVDPQAVLETLAAAGYSSVVRRS